jgi:cyclophilin family peptidyl-prolyl cis-trans isomerase
VKWYSPASLNPNNVKRLIALLTWSVFTFAIFTAHAQTSNQPNSIVRFRISYGAQLLGDIDVELFDNDKPVTVSNFLHYVQSGKYQNSLLHHCVPGSVLQGGRWTVANPFLSAPFNQVSRIPNGTSITNEFLVGRRYTNDYGTIAMAKENQNPHSATSSWFFNLGANGPNLDSKNGGFTVFGKVTSGLNVLDYFNGLSENNGILNATNALYQASCSPMQISPNGGIGFVFDALPVFLASFSCPRYSDLFAVQVIMVSGQDVIAPRLTILNPKLNEKLTNQIIVVNGTASDIVGVTSVGVSLGTNSAIVATGSNIWSVTLTNVPPGTNSITVEASDEAGNVTQIVRSFFRSVPVRFGLEVVGAGTVTGPSDGAMLELARGYKLLAKPDRGNLFVGWTGNFQETSPTLNFLMDSNTAFTATFATNLFPSAKGTYNGLVYNPDLGEQQSSGFVTLTVGNSGTYSAKLLMNGKSYPFKGSFDAYGFETNLVSRRGTNALVLQLALDLTGGSDQLTGTLASNTNQVWSADVVADRSAVYFKTNPAPQAGKYTMLVPKGTAFELRPGGDGFGMVTVSPRGGISFSGTLADGTKVSQKTSLSKEGQWPLYLSLYKGKGALVSWVGFDTNPVVTDFSGYANWFKQSQPVKHYPAGFTNESLLLLGSRFLPPPTPVLNFTDGTVGFANGNLTSDFANNVTLGLDGKVSNLSSNKLTLNISKSGLFTGSVTPPGTTTAIPFKGAVLQKLNIGSGFFLGTNQSGSVLFGP